MGIRTFSPTTPSRRFMSVTTFDDITSRKPYKPLTVGKKRTGGRNNIGWLAIRPARIALIHYADGDKRYIIAPQGLVAGQSIIASDTADILVGNTLPLKSIPRGTPIHNVEIKPGRGGQLVRSAGNSAQLLAKDAGWVQIKLPSGEIRRVLESCRATIGQVGNSDHENMSLGKAGRRRWLGIRPTVRGVAMNPVDHPLGGGEGKTSGGRHPVSPWGLPTKGYKTRNRKATDQFIVQRRQK